MVHVFLDHNFSLCHFTVHQIMYGVQTEKHFCNVLNATLSHAFVSYCDVLFSRRLIVIHCL